MKSVLITGGTGSFGQAFTERVLQDKSVERIAILSRGEHAQAEMRDRLGDARLRFFIGDVRDRNRLLRSFQGVDVVVHAAALKRIEVGFYNPTEMVATNINGAMNVIEAAVDAGVKRVVALSTDKAWQPVSPYGQSKALAETLFRNGYQGRDTRFAVTRYGNVWGSNGSVVPKWRGILKTSDTVPVTDPDATRFYMTMDEAVELVLKTINTMKGGELNIPTLPAYRLGDLAEAMGAKMNIIGLPSFEKKHEGMCDGNTSDKARRMSVDELRGILNEDGLHRTGANGLDPASWESAVAAQRPYGYRGSPYALQAHSGG
jgi:UDP-N-acetylglucosamine 4,6-dehydratase